MKKCYYSLLNYIVHVQRDLENMFSNILGTSSGVARISFACNTPPCSLLNFGSSFKPCFVSHPHSDFPAITESPISHLFRVSLSTSHLQYLQVHLTLPSHCHICQHCSDPSRHPQYGKDCAQLHPKCSQRRNRAGNFDTRCNIGEKAVLR